MDFSTSAQKIEPFSLFFLKNNLLGFLGKSYRSSFIFRAGGPKPSF